MPGKVIKLTGDFRRFSPFRTPNWRWTEALNHIRNKTCPANWEDPAIARAHQFLVELDLAHTEAERMELSRRWPELSAAHSIFTRGGVVRDELEARLLCQSPEEIAASMGIGADVVRTYATFFFDVLESLNANDWLLFQAVGLYTPSRPPTVGQRWRYLAWSAGPHVLEQAIADYLSGPEPDVPNPRDVVDPASRETSKPEMPPNQPGKQPAELVAMTQG
jgi:hypothetical protein